MKAARSILLATALCALAQSALALPAQAHNRAGAGAHEIPAHGVPARSAGAQGPRLDPGPKGVAVAGLPTAVKAADAFEERGVSCALAGDLRPAILRFPWRPRAYANRGQAYAGLGEHEFAVLDYDDAIRLAPAQHTYRYLRAVSLAEIGRAEQAVYDLERVIELHDRSVVTDLQRYLAVKGYDPGPIDGRYGPSTRRALIFCVSEKCFSF